MPATDSLRDAFVERLDHMQPGNLEEDHRRADDMLLQYLRAIGEDSLVDAYITAKARVRFAYT